MNNSKLVFQLLVKGCFLFSLITPSPLKSADQNWSVYLGGPDSSQYSTLKQIHKGNVKKLKQAWIYHCGDAASNGRSQIQCNPLIIDGVLYGTSPFLKLFALNAATGEELWNFDPLEGVKYAPRLGVNRGVVFWKEGSDRRILYCVDHYLYAVNADTGLPVAAFGDDGRVDLKIGLGRDVSRLAVLSNTPGAVFENLLFMPMRLGEGPGPAAPGHIRAYDIRTGRIVWKFNTIPSPGEFGYETWPPDAYQHIGGANVWTGMAVDHKRGLLFCPTGSAAFDFWGGNRIGENLFANCLLALDARTGKRVWHYQLVHHDLWDRDLPSPPNLITITRNGKKIDVVSQCTKSGHVFVFNRETGEPIYPIKEVMVPSSDLEGESTWPTQPLPVKPTPFARQLFSFDEITDISPESRRAILETFVKVRPHVPFMPPSAEGTIIFPGFDGAAEWGGNAADPNGILYVNSNEMPWILTMVRTQTEGGGLATTGSGLYTQICAACHGTDRTGNVAQNVPTLIGIKERLQKEEILALLNTGKGVMPSLGFLSELQKQRLVDYISDESTKPASPGTTIEAGDQADVLGKIPYGHTGYNRWLDPEGYPAVKPPWGTLNAIDLNTGEYKWKVPLGEFDELTQRGIAQTGTENYGGPIVTAGGLVFIAASKDERFRAFDKNTGETLWQTRLPAGGYATPSTYTVDGKQYVVIACGGGKMGTKSGDAYVAFSLED